MAEVKTYEAIVIGGGPAGATAARDLAHRGHSVLLIDRAGRIKPCGGAIPPRLVEDFDIPPHLLVARVDRAQIVSPSGRTADMPIGNSYVGMVDREVFDEWLRQRAQDAGAERLDGAFEKISRDTDGVAVVAFRRNGQMETVRARAIVGADGALSRVARQTVPGADRMAFVYAYHEVIRAPQPACAIYEAGRCDVYYQGTLSPDFYAWVFPHGGTASIGTGSARKGFALKEAVAALRDRAGLSGAETIRREGAPIPLKPLRRWDNGRDVVLAGDAAGVVAPASGEGIYYAMLGGQLAAQSVAEFLATGDARALTMARKRFMKGHGKVFWILGIMQHFWYRNDGRRERFVTMCKDRDVQKLVWAAYTSKQLVMARPLAHLRIFFKDVGHLLGVVPP
jgi:geranylgeranyl diphosphate/geranylgeranyl-bacteriochlorophyllide a reductase